MEEYLLEVKTIQSIGFKKITELLKDILIDCNIKFDVNGMSISAMNSKKQVLINLNIPCYNFEKYDITKTIYIGLNMFKLHSILKTVKNGDILTFYILKENPNHFNIIINNFVKGIKTYFRLPLIDLDVYNIDINDTDFCHNILVESSLLNSVLKDISMYDDNVAVFYKNNLLTFKTDNEIVRRTDICIKDDVDREDYNGVYSVEYFIIFLKFNKISKYINIKMNANSICLEYNISNLGNIKLYVVNEG